MPIVIAVVEKETALKKDKGDEVIGLSDIGVYHVNIPRRITSPHVGVLVPCISTACMIAQPASIAISSAWDSLALHYVGACDDLSGHL